MRPLRLFLVAVLAFGLAACSSNGTTKSSDSPTSDQKTTPNVTGKRLDAAETDIEKAGFDPQKIKFIGGGVLGPVVKSNWQVCSQDPAAGQPLASTLELTIERDCASGSTSADASAPSSSTPAPSSSSASTEPATLTTKNSPDLANLLKVSDPCSGAIGTFASKYPGRTIEFDGSVLDVGDAGDGTVNVLIGPGDKGSKTDDGPQFQFMGVDSSSVSDAETDDKLHIVANVTEFDADQCLLILDPLVVGLR